MHWQKEVGDDGRTGIPLHTSALNMMVETVAPVCFPLVLLSASASGTLLSKHPLRHLMWGGQSDACTPVFLAHPCTQALPCPQYYSEPNASMAHTTLSGLTEPYTEYGLLSVCCTHHTWVNVSETLCKLQVKQDRYLIQMVKQCKMGGEPHPASARFMLKG